MPAKRSPHADQRVGSHAAGIIRLPVMDDASYGAAEHRADKQAGPEDAACVSAGIAGGRRHNFQQNQQRHGADDHAAVQGLVDEVVTDSQHCGEKRTSRGCRRPIHPLPAATTG